MYSELLIYIAAGLLFVGGGLLSSRLIRPNRPNEEKLTTYESGEEPSGDARVSFPVKYYVIALIFLLFEVEIIFLFPWALVFSNEEVNLATNLQWGLLALFEMFMFLAVLTVGLVYAWKKGFLDWERAEVKPNDFVGPVPHNLYKEFNDRMK